MNRLRAVACAKVRKGEDEFGVSSEQFVGMVGTVYLLMGRV